jgi:hypothetical protein
LGYNIPQRIVSTMHFFMVSGWILQKTGIIIQTN